MRILQTGIRVLVFFVLSNSVNGRSCRSGFNTSIFDIPIAVWDESALCSSSSGQSCFLGEVTLDTSFLNDDLTLTYGSCVSTAYESVLECDSVFYGSPVPNVDALLSTLPSLEGQLDNIIPLFSDNVAENVVKFLRNENGELDGLQLLEAALTAGNVSIPANVRSVVSKWDTLIFNLLVNTPELQTVGKEFLLSFQELNTPDAAASRLIYSLFNRMNITVPDEFKPMIDNLPGFIAQYIKNFPGYEEVNGTLFNIISLIDASPGSAGRALAALLKQYAGVPDLNKLFDSLPNLIDQLAQENFDYLNSWNLGLIAAYSTKDIYTESLSNSTIDFIERIGVNFEDLPEETQVAILHLPGYFYSVFPDRIRILQMVYLNVSTLLDKVDPDNVDFNTFVTFLSTYGIDLNALGLTPVFETFTSLYGPILSQNLTKLGINAIQALQSVSTMTPQTIELGNSILQFLKRSNVELSDGVLNIIISTPGVFITAFPSEANLINYIFSNVSQGLDNYDPSRLIAATIVESVLRSLKASGLPGEVITILEKAVSRANDSTSSISVQDSFEVLNILFPFEISEDILGLDSLPEELRTTLEANFQFAASFQLEALKSFSRITPATSNFSSSVYRLLERFGRHENITEALRILIDYQPGILYLFNPSDESAVEDILYNISRIIDYIESPTNVDFMAVLQLYGIDTSSFDMESVTPSFEALFALIFTRNVTQFGTDSLNALKTVSSVTTESEQVASSIVAYLTRLGVVLGPVTREIITNIPGVFITAFPEHVKLINTIYSNISRQLDDFDPSNVDYQDIFMNSLSSFDGILPADIQGVMQQFVKELNVSDPVGSLQAAIDIVVPLIPMENNQTELVLRTLPELLNQLLQGNFNYLNTWTLKLLKSYSKITPESARLSQAVFDFADKFGLSENLTEEVKTLITYQAGYFYQLFSDLEVNTVYIDYVFDNISHVLETIISDSSVDLQILLSSIPGSALPEGSEALLKTLEDFISVASTGNINAVGEYALETLKNFSVPTTESMMLSNSTISFLERMNITLSEELKEVIRYAPGLITASYPAQVNLIDAIFANTSLGLDGADPTSASFAQFVTSLSAQLETLGFTISDEAQTLVVALPTKIDLANLVGTFTAFLEVSKAVLPTEYRDLVPLLDTLPNLLSELLNANYSYITTWQIELLELYSTTTNATEALSNSIINLVRQYSLGSILTDNVRMWITYQPGYFYQFFPDQSESFDNVFFTLAAALQNVDPAQLNLKAVLRLIPVNTTQAEFVIPALEEFLHATASSGNNGTRQLEAALVLVGRISQNSTEGTELGESLLLALQSLNIPLPQEVQDIVRYVPGFFVALFPEQSEIIESIYASAARQIWNPLNIGQTINYTFSSLEAEGLPIPEEVKLLANSLEDLLKGAITGDINQWLVDTLPLLTSSPSTNASSALATSIKRVLGQIDGFGITPGVSAAIDYVTTLPFIAVASNDTTLISVYSSVSEFLMKTDITAFSSSAFEGVFADLYAIVPMPLQPFLRSTEDLIAALVTDNTTALIEWGAYLQNQYCLSNAVTEDFSKAMFNTLVGTYDLPVPASYESIFECVPGILYTFLPNDTTTLNLAFKQAVLGITNYTALIEIQLQQVGYTMTPENIATINFLMEMQDALFRGNITRFFQLADQLQNLPVAETELSELVITILRKAGAVITEQIATSIRQSTLSFYSSVPAEHVATFDVAFASLKTDISNDVNIGTALKNAFAAANVSIPERWLPVLDNAQALIDAVMSYDGNRINQAILDLMVSYNASFPSDMLQYYIYQYRLQIAIQDLIAQNSITIPDEVFENAANMYHLLLDMFNTTENGLRDLLLEAFPDGATFIQIFFQLDPRDAFSISTKFVMWLADPERNVTTLSSLVRETTQQFLSSINVDIGGLLQTLARPISCKYKACRTDNCNSPSLLNDVIAVLPSTITTALPEETTFIDTTIIGESTAVFVMETTAQTDGINLEMTTTASGRRSTGVFNSCFIIVTTILSSKWLFH